MKYKNIKITNTFALLLWTSLLFGACEAENGPRETELVAGCYKYVGSDSLVDESYCQEDGGERMFQPINSYWTLLRGKAREYSTWHSHDHAVELLEADPIISRYVSGLVANNIRFLVDREGDSSLEVLVDFFDLNYHVESTIGDPIPGEWYEQSESGQYPSYRASFPVTADEWEWADITFVRPEWADEMSVSLVKKGGGSVKVTRLELRSVYYEKHPDSYFGRSCQSDEDCENSYCVDWRTIDGDGQLLEGAACSSCASDEHCDGEGICGLTYYDDRRGCVVPNAKPLGERCAVDGECATGTCCQSICSACCEDKGGCPDEGSCSRVLITDPFQCDPGQRLYEENESCFRNDDCAQGHCVGDGEVSWATTNCPPDGSTCLSKGQRYGVCE